MLWDVAPEHANLDATLQDLTMMMDDDVDNIIARASSRIGTMHGWNEFASVAATGDDENVDFFENTYDFEWLNVICELWALTLDWSTLNHELCFDFVIQIALESWCFDYYYNVFQFGYDKL